MAIATKSPTPTPKSETFEVWQSRQHFNFADPWEHVEFAVYSTYDVVAGPGWRIQSSHQAFNELWLIGTGEVQIEQNGRIETARAPCVALIRGGQSRDTRQMGSDSLSIVGFSFGATLWGALDFLDFAPSNRLWNTPTHQFENLVTRIVEESKIYALGRSLAIQGLGQLALVEFWRAQGEAETPNARNMALALSSEFSAVLNLVAAQFGEPLDVERLARAAHLSPKHFGRKFHAALGITPMDYVRRVRLSRARDLLATSEVGVAQIAGQCGFENGAHFSRAFKAHFGASPLEFRRSLRQLTRP